MVGVDVVIGLGSVRFEDDLNCGDVALWLVEVENCRFFGSIGVSGLFLEQDVAEPIKVYRVVFPVGCVLGPMSFAFLFSVTL